jgi:hypothetical protein
VAQVRMGAASEMPTGCVDDAGHSTAWRRLMLLSWLMPPPAAHRTHHNNTPAGARGSALHGGQALHHHGAAPGCWCRWWRWGRQQR